MQPAPGPGEHAQAKGSAGSPEINHAVTAYSVTERERSPLAGARRADPSGSTAGGATPGTCPGGFAGGPMTKNPGRS